MDSTVAIFEKNWWTEREVVFFYLLIIWNLYEKLKSLKSFGNSLDNLPYLKFRIKRYITYYNLEPFICIIIALWCIGDFVPVLGKRGSFFLEPLLSSKCFFWWECSTSFTFCKQFTNFSVITSSISTVFLV